MGEGVRDECCLATCARLPAREPRCDMEWDREWTFFLASRLAGLMVARLDGGKMLADSVCTWDGGETESPLQNDCEPMAMPLSGELRLWV